jgi:radical SAM protein with 4Fe4S-binding SPASM domain
MLPIPLGNLRTESFAGIWRNSPVIEALHNRKNLEGRCGTCFVKDKCGGCRAVAFAKAGSYLASDPRCWRVTVEEGAA